MSRQDGVAGGSCLPFSSDLKCLSFCFLWIQLGMNFKQIKHDVPVLHIETFNSTKKRAGVVFKVRISLNMSFTKLCW
jgi:hypothetical protein